MPTDPFAKFEEFGNPFEQKNVTTKERIEQFVHNNSARMDGDNIIPQLAEPLIELLTIN